MKRNILFGAAVIGWVLTTGQASLAEETKTLFGDALKKADIKVSGTTSVYSKYMWRGFRLYDDYVTQPSININAFGDWNLNVWGSYDTSNYADAPNANETDTTLTYTHKFEDLKLGSMGLDPVSLTLGYIYYDFSGAGTFSKETILGVGYDTFLSPSLTWYHDHGRESQGGGDGDYLVLKLAKSLDVIKSYGVTLDLSGHVGYNKHLYIRGEGGDVLLTTGLTVPLTSNLKITPSVNWNAPFGGVKDDHNDDGDIKRKSEFFWGTTLTYNF